ncbi:MAG: carbon-nitrogen hydrolase [Candidatus Gracilibacteria bacterium]|jgi:agmatine deiminase
MIKHKFVKIGLVQAKVSKNQNANLKKTATKIEEAANKGAKIICLQELYKTIYFPQYEKGNKDEYVERIPGPSTEVFSLIAKKYRAVIIVPVYEKSKGKYFNSVVVIDEKGKLLPIYHKIHIPHDPLFYEKNYFEEGDYGYRIYKTKYATFAVLICFDQWYPEAARTVSLLGAEIIFYPTAIGYIRGQKQDDGDWHDSWETIQRSHAIANAVHVAAVNRVGIEDGLNFWGQSFVCDSFGQVIKRASDKKEEVIVAKIDLGKNRHIQESWGFFRNRRPDTYSHLTKGKNGK